MLPFFSQLIKSGVNYFSPKLGKRKREDEPRDDIAATKLNKATEVYTSESPSTPIIALPPGPPKIFETACKARSIPPPEVFKNQQSQHEKENYVKSHVADALQNIQSKLPSRGGQGPATVLTPQQLHSRGNNNVPWKPPPTADPLTVPTAFSRPYYNPEGFSIARKHRTAVQTSHAPSAALTKALKMEKERKECQEYTALIQQVQTQRQYPQLIQQPVKFNIDLTMDDPFEKVNHAFKDVNVLMGKQKQIGTQVAKIAVQDSRVSMIDAEHRAIQLEEAVKRTGKQALYRLRQAEINAIQNSRSQKVEASREKALTGLNNMIRPSVLYHRPAPPAPAPAPPQVAPSHWLERAPAKKAPTHAAEEDDAVDLVSSDEEEEQDEGNVVYDDDEEQVEVDGEEDGSAVDGEEEEEEEQSYSRSGVTEEEEEEVSAAVSGIRLGAVPLRSHRPSEAALKAWRRAMSGGDGGEEVVAHEASNIAITRSQMQCMAPGQWLNDEVINLYLYLLQERDTRLRGGQDGHKYPKCHFFSTFFLNKLYKDKGVYKYDEVRRWTIPTRLKLAGQASSCILDCDKIILPVHQGIHWTAAVIDLARKEVAYYDSMGGEDDDVIDSLLQYIKDEAKNKRQQDWDVSEWRKRYPKDIPRQRNGCDCGVFTIMYADYFGMNKPWDFAQEHMDDIRINVVYDLIRQRVD